MTYYPYLRRILIGLISLVLFWGWLDAAHAETMPATEQTGAPIAKYYGACGSLCGIGDGVKRSFDEAKTAAEAACAAAGIPYPVGGWVNYSATCVVRDFNNGGYTTRTASAAFAGYFCPDGTAKGSLDQLCATGYTCPSGWTLNGNQCSRPDCGSGEFRASDGTCKKDCSSKNGQSTPNPRYEGNGGSPTNIDLGGCQARCTVNVIMNDGWAGESCTYTGRPADSGSSAGAASDPPPRDEPDSPADCGGQGMGYVRSSTGKITCVPQSDAPPDNQPTVTTEKGGSTTGTPPSSGSGSGSGSGTSGSGGAPGTPGGPAGSVIETTTCKGPNCSTTTTTSQQPDTVTNGTGNGGCPQGWTLVNGKCESTVVTEQPTTDYCQRNPLAPQCKGLTDECAEHPERVSCMSVGNTTETPDPTPRGMTMGNIIALNMGGNNSCPSDVPLPAGAVFSYQKICEGLEMVRPIIIALAWLAAAFIVFGHKKES